MEEFRRIGSTLSILWIASKATKASVEIESAFVSGVATRHHPWGGWSWPWNAWSQPPNTGRVHGSDKFGQGKKQKYPTYPLTQFLLHTDLLKILKTFYKAKAWNLSYKWFPLSWPLKDPKNTDRVHGSDKFGQGKKYKKIQYPLTQLFLHTDPFCKISFVHCFKSRSMLFLTYFNSVDIQQTIWPFWPFLH